MLNFVLCDDNSSDLDNLSRLLDAVFIQNGHDTAQISEQFVNPKELLSYLKKETPDVICLEINFNSNFSGLEIAESIRKFNKRSHLIFITNHTEYSLDAYQFKTFDYIPKPVTIEKLSACVKRIFDDVSKSPYFLKVGKATGYINENIVHYIQKEGTKLIYQTQDGPYESYASFKQIESTLPSHFIRCHKSYIVNEYHISHVESQKNLIYFSNGETCSIGPKYKNHLLEVIENHGNHTNDKTFVGI